MLIGFYLVAPGSGAPPSGGTSHRGRHSPGAPHAGGATRANDRAPMSRWSMPKEEAQTRQGHDASRDAECGAAAAAGSRPKHSYVWRRGAHAGICDVRDSPGHKKAALEMRWIQPDITKRTPSLSLVQTESLLRTCSGCGDAGNQSPLLPLNPLRLRLLAVKFSLR